jgi:hypothetical protein
MIHTINCLYEAKGILTPDCPVCEILVKDISSLDDRFSVLKMIANKKCCHCDSVVIPKTTGLPPHGISLICVCQSKAL